MADIVFGDFDVIAIFPRLPQSDTRMFFDIVERIGSIRKTTTFRHLDMSEQDTAQGKPRAATR